MYLDEEQIKPFIGLEKYNEQGKDLKTFLEEYDPKKYDNPCNTVDTCVFTYDKDVVVKRVLLIRRKNHPSIGMWALPGGFVEYKEDIDIAAMRELEEETGVKDIEAEQFKSYGAYDRDPRTRIITTAYAALIPDGSVNPVAGDDARDTGWFDISDVREDIFIDENGIIHDKHCLTLTKSDDSSVVTTSHIEITYKKNAILKNVHYKVLDTQLLAADHGAVVLEGYQYVCKKINEH